MADQTIKLTFSEEMELSYLNLVSDKISKDISNVRLQSLSDSMSIPELVTVSSSADVNESAPAIVSAEKQPETAVVSAPSFLAPAAEIGNETVSEKEAANESVIPQAEQQASAPIQEPEQVFLPAAEELPLSVESAPEPPENESVQDVLMTSTGPTIESITGYDVEDPYSVTVNVTLSGPGSESATTYYTVNGSPWTEFMDSFILSENCQFMVKAEDTDGNQTWSEVLNVTTIGFADDEGPVIDSISGYDVPSPDFLMIDVSVTDPQSGVANTYYSFNGSPWIEFMGSFTLTENGPFKIKAVDNAGNQTRSQVLYATGIVDMLPPVINSFSGYATTAVVAETIVNRVNFQVDAYDNSGMISRYTLSYNDQTEQVYPDTVGCFFKDFSSDFIGFVNFTITVYDAAGNSADAFTAVDIPDIIPPEFLNYSATAAFDLYGNGKLFWTAATDNCGEISRYEIKIYEAEGPLLHTFESFDPYIEVFGLAAGNYQFEVAAYDPANNSSVSPRTDFAVAESGGVVQVYSSGVPIITQFTPLVDYTLTGSAHQMQVFSGGQTVGTTIKNAAVATLNDLGAMEQTNISSGCFLVLHGGYARGNEVTEGGAMIVQAGLAVSNTVHGAGAAVEVNQVGTLEDTSIADGATVVAKNGGRLVSGHVADNSLLFVSNGGNVNYVTAGSEGSIAFDSGANGSNIQVNDGAAVFISRGANVQGLNMTGNDHFLQLGIDPETNVQIISAGQVYTLKSGSMDSASADAGTYLDVYAGGVVHNLYTTGYIEPYASGAGGVMQLHSGATGYNVDNHMSGQINVYSGAYLSGAATDTEGEIYLGRPWEEDHLGGRAENITLNSNGYLWVFTEGQAENVFVNQDGRVQVSSGGSLTNGHISSGGHMIVVDHGRVSDSEVFSGGIMEICGGEVSGVVVDPEGLLTFSSSYTDVHGVSHYVESGIVSDVIVRESALMEAKLGGSAYQTVVTSGGSARVSNNGLIADAEIQSGGFFYAQGGEFRNVSFEDGSQLVIYDSVNGSDISISSGTDLVFFTSPTSMVSGTCGGYNFTEQSGVLDGLHFYIGNLNVVNSVTVTNLTAQGGYVILNSGNNLSSGQIVDSGSLLVHSGATASDVVISNGGQADFYSGSIGQQITVGDSSWMRSSGENVTIQGLTLNAGGGVLLQAGTTVDNLVVNANGLVGIYAGARAVNVTIENDGRMDGTPGAVITGNINLGASANFYVGGATIEFALAGKQAGQPDFLMNHIDRVLGAAEYVLSVTANQECGQYKLASFASAYSISTLQLQIIDEVTMDLTFGSPVFYDGNQYSLLLDGTDLIFEISHLGMLSSPSLKPESGWDTASLVPESDFDSGCLDNGPDLFSEASNSLADSLLSPCENYEDLFRTGTDGSLRQPGTGWLA